MKLPATIKALMPGFAARAETAFRILALQKRNSTLTVQLHDERAVFARSSANREARITALHVRCERLAAHLVDLEAELDRRDGFARPYVGGVAS